MHQENIPASAFSLRTHQNRWSKTQRHVYPCSAFLNDCLVTKPRLRSPPTLEPAQPLALGFLESLIRSLGGSSTAEILPENVLAKGDQMIAWWTAACRRQMFYENSEQKATGLNGRTFPQPPLVWRVDGDDLKIRALAENKRPAALTTLAVAPFWNLSDDGRVCTGTMRRPDSVRAASIPGWERGFYESAFTHANVGRLTRHPGGFEGLFNRINLFWGTSWSAIPNHFHARSFDRTQDRCPDLVFGCVDTRAARKAIEDSFSRALSRTCYRLDLATMRLAANLSSASR